MDSIDQLKSSLQDKISDEKQKLSQKLKSKTKELGEEVSEKSRDFVIQGKKDAENLQQHIILVIKTIIEIYVAGFLDSLNFIPNMIFTSSNSNQKKILIHLAIYLSSISLFTFILKDYLQESVYLFFIIACNEILNYNLVLIEFSQTFTGKINEYHENLYKSAENLLNEVSSLIDNKNDSKIENKEEKEKKKKKLIRNTIFAKIIVAKVMSYSLICAYLQEISDFLGYFNYLNIIDFPITAILIAYFIAENRILVFKKKKTFVERVEYLKSFIVYLLGYGTLIALIYLLVPNGEYWASLYHIFLISSQFKHEERTSPVIDIDFVAYAERICLRVTNYFV